MEVAPRYTLSTLFTLLTLSILFEVFFTAYACMPRYILLGKVRTQLDWADQLLNKMWLELTG